MPWISIEAACEVKMKTKKSNEAASWGLLLVVGLLLIFLSIIIVYVSNFAKLEFLSLALIIMAIGLMCIIPPIAFLIKRKKNPGTTELTHIEMDLLSDIGLGIIVIFSGMASVLAFMSRSNIFFLFFLICFLFGPPLIYKYLIKKKKEK
jgi:hypothetical protein